MLQRRNVLLSQRCKFFGHEFGGWMQVRIEPDWKSFRVFIFRKARMSHYRMSLELAPVLLAEMRGASDNATEKRKVNELHEELE